MTRLHNGRLASPRAVAQSGRAFGWCPRRSCASGARAGRPRRHLVPRRPWRRRQQSTSFRREAHRAQGRSRRRQQRPRGRREGAQRHGARKGGNRRSRDRRGGYPPWGSPFCARSSSTDGSTWVSCKYGGLDPAAGVIRVNLRSSSCTPTGYQLATYGEHEKISSRSTVAIWIVATFCRADWSSVDEPYICGSRLRETVSELALT